MNKTFKIVEQAGVTISALIVLGGFFFSPVSTHADVTLDATSTSGSEGSVSSFSWNHTVGGGSNSLLLVSLSIQASDDEPEPVQSVSYDGTSLTELVAAKPSLMEPFTSELWYLVNPASGSYPISVSLATTTTDIAGGAYSFFGVDSVNPFDATTTAQGFFVTSTTADLVIANNNEYIVDSLATDIGNGTSSASTGQTPLYEYDIASSSETLASSYELIPTAQVASTGWNFSQPSLPALAAAAIAPAPTLSSIAITTPATKLSYTVGDPLDLTGLGVTGTYSDGSTSTEPIDASDVSGFDSSTSTPSETLTIAVGTATTTYAIAVAPAITVSTSTPPSVAITPASLPDAMVGSGYSQTIAASDGDASDSFTWTIATDTLSADFAVTTSTTGVTITGTPSGTGAYELAVMATSNSYSTSSLENYSLTIDAAPVAASGGGGGGSSASSGGGDYNPYVPPPVTSSTSSIGVVLGASTTNSVALLQVLQNLMQQLVTLEFQANNCSFVFDKNLVKGVTSPDVRNLQTVLNYTALTQVVTTGPGSPGDESTYFGAATKNAVAAFQNIFANQILTPNGMTSGNGYVGSATRAVLNGLCTK